MQKSPEKATYILPRDTNLHIGPFLATLLSNMLIHNTDLIHNPNPQHAATHCATLQHTATYNTGSCQRANPRH